MAIARVGNNTEALASSATSCQITFPSNVTAGNRVVVSVSCYQTDHTNPPNTDDIAKTSGTATIGAWSRDGFAEVDRGTGAWNYAALFSAEVYTTGSLTVTVTGNGSNGSWALSCDELSANGTPIVEDGGTGNGSTGAAVTDDMVASGAAVWFGCATYGGTGTDSVTEDSPWTMLQEHEDGGTGQMYQFCYRTSTGPTTDAASWSSPTTRYWAACGAVYREPSILAVRFTDLGDGNGDILYHTQNLPAMNAVSFCGWLHMRGDPRADSYRYGLGFENTVYPNHAGNYMLFGRNTINNWGVAAWDGADRGAGFSGGGAGVPTGRWVYVALASGTGGYKAWWVDPTDPATVWEATQANQVTFTPAAFLIGNDSWHEYTLWAFANIMVWNVEVTKAEMIAQMSYIEPNRRQNLWAWWKLRGASDLSDYSGNGRTLTKVGNCAAVTGPPTPERPMLYRPAGRITRR